MQPADLIAIVLLLAALIDCVDHLWSRPPPATGMLGGSLALSLPIVLGDRLFHLHMSC